VRRAARTTSRLGSRVANRGGTMDQVCLVLPIKQGKSDVARAFMNELETERKHDYAISERRIGIDKEAWYVASTPAGDQFVAYMESPDFEHALDAFCRSRDQFDLWFKERLDESTGLDLNHPPEGMTLPELMSSYIAA
jgi:hypothetical protein